MDQTPQLLSSVQFDEAKKGYDRDQVDNFLRELSVKVAELKEMLREATARAEAAEAAANDAAKGRRAAEAALDQARGDVDRAKAEAAESAAAAATADQADKAAGVLALAEKTARQAITDARAKAEQMLTEATAEAEKARADGIAAAERDAGSRAAELQKGIDALVDERDDLSRDVTALRDHLDRERIRLRDTVADLQRIVDAPDALAAPEPPVDTELRGGTRAGGRPTPAADEPTAEEPADPEPAPVAAEDEDDRPGPAAPRAAGTDPSEGGGGEEPGLSVVTVDDMEARRPARIDETNALGTEGRPPGEAERGDIDLTEAPTAAYDVLGEGGDEGGAGPEVEERPTRDVPQARSPLGEPDEDADAAMKAFFESDEGAAGGQGPEGRRFLRRR